MPWSASSAASCAAVDGPYVRHGVGMLTRSVASSSRVNVHLPGTSSTP
jgi:hypothetical protein